MSNKLEKPKMTVKPESLYEHLGIDQHLPPPVPCPTCGCCPTCGRRNYSYPHPIYPRYPYSPWPYGTETVTGTFQ